MITEIKWLPPVPESLIRGPNLIGWGGNAHFRWGWKGRITFDRSGSRFLFSPFLPFYHHTYYILQNITMDDPYEDRSMPADTGYGNYDADDLVDLENMKPPEVDYYAVLNLSKTVRNRHPHFLLTLAAVAWSMAGHFSIELDKD